jgi:hypothetical protein
VAKLTLTDLVNITNETTVVAAINANNTAIETAMENTLSRDGTTPNTMGADLDMNSNQIINLPAAGSDTEPIRKAEFDDYTESVTGLVADAESAAAAAALSELNAAGSASSATGSASAAATSASNAATSATNASNSAAAAAASAAETAGAIATHVALADPHTQYVLESTIGSAVQAYDADLASWAALVRASGFDTFVVTPSSANLRSLVTDETGSGSLVFATSPTLVTPVLGTPTSGTLTNCTGLPTAGIVNDAVTNAKLANMATATFKGRTTSGTGDPEDLTATQATALLNTAVGDSGSGGTKGLVPAPVSGDATKFLRGDMTYVTIPGGGDALTTNSLAQFASTTSAQLRGVLSDETGTGAAVFADAPQISTIELGHVSDTTISRASAGVIAVEGSNVLMASGAGTTHAAANVGQGQHTIWVPAGAMTPQTTNGAASGSLEMTTNDVMLKYLAFDASTQEFAQFSIQMPKSWNEGTIVAQFIWTHPSTTTNFGVAWELGSVAFADDDALDTAFGTEVTVTDTGGTTHDCYISAESSAMTVAGSPTAEELVYFRVTRDPANGSDNMAVDAWLLGVKLHYTTNDDTDD